jgi:hypothetical protein
MLIYPQLGTGALAQCPIMKRRRTRTVANEAADGTSIRMADPAAEITEWRLEYSGITDLELAALEGFFRETEGALRTFTFVDPTANLLASSSTLSDAVWQRDPFLTISGGVSDAFGGNRAWQLTNSGGAPQCIAQILMAPGDYTYCLSAYVRGALGSCVRMSLGPNCTEKMADPNWLRITLTGSGEAGAEFVRVGLELPPGGCIEVFGLQIDPQPNPSEYRDSVGTGIYQTARFRDDAFSATSVGPNWHSCTVNIIHVNHL